MNAQVDPWTSTAMVLAQKICPKAPPGAVEPTNQLTGYVLWGVGILFVIGIVVVFVSAVAFLALPTMLDGILGSGCI